MQGFIWGEWNWPISRTPWRGDFRAGVKIHQTSLEFSILDAFYGIRRFSFFIALPQTVSNQKISINLGWRVWKIQRPFQLNSSPEGILRISSDRDDRMGAKIKTPKNPLGLKKKKNRWTKIYPPKTESHAEIPSRNKNFQEAWNDITRKIERFVLNTQKNPYL